jgi:hypothetical protein
MSSYAIDGPSKATKMAGAKQILNYYLLLKFRKNEQMQVNV